MNRAERRRREKAIATSPEKVYDYEGKSLKRLRDIKKNELFEVLRSNRIGKERANKVIKEYFEEL